MKALAIPTSLSEPAKTVRDNSHDVSSSKKERDARRAKEFRARKGVAFRWELLTTKLKRIENFHLRSVVWVQWMKAKPMKECIQARFPRGAVAATVSGGDPDGRRFYEFDDPACAMLPGLRQEPIHMSDATDLKPIQEGLTDPLGHGGRGLPLSSCCCKPHPLPSRCCFYSSSR